MQTFNNKRDRLHPYNHWEILAFTRRWCLCATK